MVSPPYKGGYGAEDIEALAPDGESVAYFSKGTFAGILSSELPIDYLARRGPSGWSTSPLTAPDSLLGDELNQEVSSTLGTIVEVGKSGPNLSRAFQEGEELILAHPTDMPDTGEADWELVGGKPVEPFTKEGTTTATIETASADLCHIVLGNSPSPLLPEAAEYTAQAQAGLRYELSRGCGGESSGLQLIGVDNAQPQRRLIDASCGYVAGGGPSAGGRGGYFNSVSQDGKEIFFTASASSKCEERELFLDVDGMRTIEVSRPPGACLEVPCEGAAGRAPATFIGASRDGSRVLFTTGESLLENEADTSPKLYLATIGCPSGLEGEACVNAGEADEMELTSLVQVTRDPNQGEQAGYIGTVQIAPDASHVYFVATGDLLDAAEREAAQAEGLPVPQSRAMNLYVYGTAAGGAPKFIDDLCTGQYRSGEAYDPRCPSAESDDGLWGGQPEAQTAGPSGEFLLFATYAQLTSNDTDNAKDAYRYDASTNSLLRVSQGEAAGAGNGNCDEHAGESACDATITVDRYTWGEVRREYAMDSRAISEDGARAVFITQQALSPSAGQGVANVYEWQEGQEGPGEGSVSMISSGSGESISHAVISPSGRDIFFITSQQLGPQDTDEAPDIYDARIDGGFTPSFVVPEPCEGDACYGPLTNPAPLLVPGSAVQEPGGNIAMPSSKPAAKTKGRRPAKSGKHKRRRHRHKHPSRRKHAQTTRNRRAR